MKNIFKKVVIGMAAIALLPAFANAETVVNSEKELLDALKTDETVIVLGQDIDTTQKINVTRDVTIDGKGYTLNYTGKFYDKVAGAWVDDNTVWSSPTDGTGAAYVIHVFMANVTLKDLGLTGGNKGLCVNGGDVTLDGSIVFGNNGFQAIELGHGSAVPADKVSTLRVSENTLIIDLDLVLNPDKVDSATLHVDDAVANLVKKNGETKKIEELQVGTNYTEDKVNVNLLYHVNEEEGLTSDVIEDAKNSNQNLVLVKLDENEEIVYGWEFDSNSITDTTIDVNTNITFTEAAPEEVKTDLEKLVTTYKDVNYLNFEHNGKLPGTANIIYYVGDKYAAGTELYVAHYNETSKELEEAMTVTVDEGGYIEFDITECSSYVLYTGIDENTDSGETAPEVKPPQTGDINLYVIVSLILVAVAGSIFASKKIAAKVK